jgi:hypothetical protein
MLYGTIYRARHNGMITIQVDGCKEWHFMCYSMKEAIREYRRRFNLVRKHIHFIDMNN